MKKIYLCIFAFNINKASHLIVLLLLCGLVTKEHVIATIKDTGEQKKITGMVTLIR